MPKPSRQVPYLLVPEPCNQELNRMLSTGPTVARRVEVSCLKRPHVELKAAVAQAVRGPIPALPLCAGIPQTQRTPFTPCHPLYVTQLGRGGWGRQAVFEFGHGEGTPRPAAPFRTKSLPREGVKIVGSGLK